IRMLLCGGQQRVGNDRKPQQCSTEDAARVAKTTAKCEAHLARILLAKGSGVDVQQNAVELLRSHGRQVRFFTRPAWRANASVCWSRAASAFATARPVSLSR